MIHRECQALFFLKKNQNVVCWIVISTLRVKTDKKREILNIGICNQVTCDMLPVFYMWVFYNNSSMMKTLTSDKYIYFN